MRQKYLAMLACIGTGISISIGIGFGQAHAAGPDPADANTVNPPTIYQSPFTDYRPLGEDKSTPWKEANDTVGKIGGWRAYAREAADAMKAREAAPAGGARPAASPPSPDKSPPPSPPQPHKHGG